ncbi:hypothetical protein AB0F17_43055 [Nonomuraea sp. NPDC026600]|uniref:hypothetical protein n=1 Tax=Nonomuraea sp. NPDC026600 TaxID=3155363 RepID=UPI00340AFEB5
MSGVFHGSVRAFKLGPSGASPTDANGWQDIGLLDVDGLSFAPDLVTSAERLETWASPGRLEFTIPIRMIRCSWWAHRFFYRRPHPGQRRAKTLYQQRARHRTGRRR